MAKRKRTLERNSADFGEAFETYICHELRSYFDYVHAGRLELNYWRSTSAFEVDFILAHKTAIEVKASQNVPLKMLRGLKALQKEKFARRHI
jgi:predicted AAA+ superfamily ATPase